MIHRVPLRLVPDIWPAIEEYAARACEHHPFLEAEDLFTILMNGFGQLFVATDGAGIEGFAVVEVIRFPRVVAGNVVAAGGRHGFLETLRKDLLLEMESWSKEHGATVFSLSGRPGWIRVGERLGFRTERTAQVWRPIDGQ